MASTDRRQHWMNVLFPDTIDFPGNTDGIIAPSGLTSERPSVPVNGYIRYNSTTKVIEGYVNGVWVELGSAGSGGVATFTDLSDTPNTYSGSPNKILRVNIGATGLEFVDGSTLYLPLSGGTMDAGQHITMAGGTVKGVPSPQFNNDVANKEYVDAIAAGLAIKESVHSATTGPINLATQGLAGIDGHAPYIDGERVLVKDQVNPVENGIYAAHTGPWTRTLDMDGTPANEVQGGTTTYVQEGTANGQTSWVVIWHGNVVVDTDPMNWSLLSAGSTQSLWATFQDDAAGTITATSPIDTLIVAGGTGISTVVAGSTLTVTNDAPNIVQDTYDTITGNNGTAQASGDANDLAIVGDGVTVSTAITNGPDVLTISVIGGPLASRLQDSDNNTFIDLEYAFADSNNIRIETGLNPGVAGGDIDVVTSVGADGKRGGDVDITCGDGGLFSVTPGDGGSTRVFGGDGGDGDFISNTGGAGGNIELSGGEGGSAFNAGVGGDVIIVPGAAGTGAGAVDGDVVLGLAAHVWPNTDGGGGEVLTTDGAGNLSFAVPVAPPTELPRPYDLAAQVLGVVTTSTTVFSYMAPRDFILYSYGHQAASAGVPNADAEFDVTLNGSSIGTFTFYSGGGSSLPSFDFGSTTGTPTLSHAISRGDILRIESPAAGDMTGFDDVNITLRGVVEPVIPTGTISAAFAAQSPATALGAATANLTLNTTGTVTYIEYACIAYSVNSGTTWYAMDDDTGGINEGDGLLLNTDDIPGGVTLDKESEYAVSTDSTPAVRNSILGSGSDIFFRFQATVFGPAGIATAYIDVQFEADLN